LAQPIRIAVDAMGGDHAPAPIVQGAVEASRRWGHEILLVGFPDVLQKELSRLKTENLPIRIIPCDSVVTMEDSPAQGCRQKPNSSIMVATKLVADKKADAVVSAGNSGATMAAALWHMRRLPHVSRPAITTFLPTLTGFCVLTDAGANVDCKPKHLLQFAIMGNQVMKLVFGRSSPKVGILSIGEESSKGNELTLAASDMLKKHMPNFVGNVEGRDIPKGLVDVVVCDGFVGNVVLKFAEGLAESLVTLIRKEISSRPLAKLGGFFMRGSLREVKRKTDYAEYGGAPLLGVNGVCIICHGKSNKKAIYNAVRVAGQFVQSDVNHLIQEELHKHHDAGNSSEERPKVHLTV
jgi:glycerol-3-phosphate acyltransferase PlsX